MTPSQTFIVYPIRSRANVSSVCAMFSSVTKGFVIMMMSDATSAASLAIESAFNVLQCPLFQNIALRGIGDSRGGGVC